MLLYQLCTRMGKPVRILSGKKYQRGSEALPLCVGSHFQSPWLHEDHEKEIALTEICMHFLPFSLLLSKLLYYLLLKFTIFPNTQITLIIYLTNLFCGTCRARTMFYLTPRYISYTVFALSRTNSKLLQQAT